MTLPSLAAPPPESAPFTLPPADARLVLAGDPGPVDNGSRPVTPPRSPTPATACRYFLHKPLGQAGIHCQQFDFPGAIDPGPDIACPGVDRCSITGGAVMKKLMLATLLALALPAQADVAWTDGMLVTYDPNETYIPGGSWGPRQLAGIHPLAPGWCTPTRAFGIRLSCARRMTL